MLLYYFCRSKDRYRIARILFNPIDTLNQPRAIAKGRETSGFFK